MFRAREIGAGAGAGLSQINRLYERGIKMNKIVTLEAPSSERATVKERLERLYWLILSTQSICGEIADFPGHDNVEDHARSVLAIQDAQLHELTAIMAAFDMV